MRGHGRDARGTRRPPEARKFLSKKEEFTRLQYSAAVGRNQPLRHVRSARAPTPQINTLAGKPIFPYPDGMDVQFDSNLEARLTERAAQQGRKPDEFVQDVVARYLEEEDRFIEAVKRGEDALERGEYLTHEQVGERLRRYLHP